MCFGGDVGVYAHGDNVRERSAATPWYQGPTLIEAVTYRIGAHSTVDDATRYRSPEAVAMWQERDPIERYGVSIKQVDINARIAAKGLDVSTAGRTAGPGRAAAAREDRAEQVGEAGAAEPAVAGAAALAGTAEPAAEQVGRVERGAARAGAAISG